VLLRSHGDFVAFIEERPARCPITNDMAACGSWNVGETINPKPGSGIGR